MGKSGEQRSLPPVPTASPLKGFIGSRPHVRTHHEKQYAVQKCALISVFPITNSWHSASLTGSFCAHRVSDTW